MPANPLLPSPAPEILDYLARHPDAQDTIDGILHWWVLDSCVKRWAPKIAETVAKLVEQGFLEEKPSPDGQTFYHVSSRYLSTLQEHGSPNAQFHLKSITTKHQPKTARPETTTGADETTNYGSNLSNR